MFETFSHRFKSWLWFQKSAQTRYYIHSPYVFAFYCNVLDEPFNATCSAIEALWLQTKVNDTPVQIEDFGAKKGTYTSSLSYLAKNVAIQPKYGKVLHHFLKWNEATYVLELGTSLGFGTAFMASAKPGIELTTIDASASVQNYAKTFHQSLGLKNISYINATFDDTLPKLLNDYPRLDVVYIDGNHTYEATLRYFHMLLPKCTANTVLIFDDIYWSKGMTDAWTAIKQNENVRLTIDIFQLGFVFFRTERLAKEDFILRY
ncbi:MAG: class I SAM-dependent methyltransferase [Chitinophagales bacterium]|jgi:predicted O-methyltransferase YrrM|nr:class I SAM-dependent methyltransferase [Chitinophagales bacterium]